MHLKPQDVLVALKLIAQGEKPWSYHQLAVELGMSPSEVHHSVRRATVSGLLFRAPRPSPGGRRGVAHHAPNRAALREFLVHGLHYVYPPERGGEARGMPTAHAASPLRRKIRDGDHLPPVWPSPHGTVRGLAFSPLYRSAPEAASRDPALYELLALVDALRGGRARERDLARHEIEKRLAS